MSIFGGGATPAAPPPPPAPAAPPQLASAVNATNMNPNIAAAAASGQGFAGTISGSPEGATGTTTTGKQTLGQ
jgi:hypothetical protein